MIDTKEIRAQMARNGKSIKGLSEQIGVSGATLGRWLSAGDMPIKYAEKLATELGIPKNEWAGIFFCDGVA